ncbi:MAG TPA: amidohydrolase family protein [Gemmatimonadales bacterium]|nr:amidohydrolase family protein [Gemmatimonadales bacterium]
MLRIRVGMVYPVTAPPIPDGAVLVDEAGRIAALGPERDVPTPRGVAALRFPDASLVPGLVNLHTHLELTHLAGQNAEPEFARWIRRIRELKEATPPEAFVAAAEQGLRACWEYGVTCVAETGSTGATIEVLARLGGRGIVYHEAFGPDPSQAAGSLSQLQRDVHRLRAVAGPRVRIGVSPHAPYTVSETLYRGVAGFAMQQGLPMAVHLAESPAETSLVRDGGGPFAEALRRRGIVIEPRHTTPVGYLARLGVLRPGTLAIHCVQIDSDDVATLRSTGAAVAHCPRSNRTHGHGTAPLAALRGAGVPVGLGTDSAVSVPDLSLWSEAEAAGLVGDEALRLLTLEGARALGWADEIGSLEVGKSADLAVFPALARPRPPSTALLTVVQGRIVQRA